MDEEKKEETVQPVPEEDSKGQEKEETVQPVPEEGSKGQKKGITRRSLIAGVAAGIVGGALAGAGVTSVVKDNAYNDSSPDGMAYDRIDLTPTIPYYDQEHPCGIQTMQQRYLTFAMMNMREGTTREDLQLLLARWTAAIATMQEGKPLGDIRPTFSESSVPDDMGEAYEIAPCSLTVTIGFGESLFDDRFGIADYKPEKLVEFTRITNERLDPEEQGSDFGIQICADDRQVVFHALRSLAKIGQGVIEFKMLQHGFKPARQSDSQTTPRDLFGFRDGTTNPVEDQEFDDFVWVSGGDQEWLEGGSYMVYRNTAIIVGPWENMRISEQERLIGRRKDTGAPLSNPDGDEFDLPDFTAKDEDGNYLIDPCSHVAITSDQRLGFKICRRDFNYWTGLDEHGDQDCGFLNMAYVNDPYNYWKLRDDMGRFDILNEYYYDTRSGLWAVPQSPKSGHYIGQEFFE